MVLVKHIAFSALSRFMSVGVYVKWLLQTLVYCSVSLGIKMENTFTP